ncbi:hypothetical protein H8E88_28645 [candidate division KSB1 bacterium]|nr:hypothetical protein [candidate division KSB1 bacterium]MBL7092933.1 hypothetical protein [candidate division KSB1 bacterium]
MDLSKLISLQRIDKQLIALEITKGDLPEIVQQLEGRLVSCTNRLSNSKSELEEAKKTGRANENEIDELYEKLMKYQEQSYSVKTNKEYDAITIEIETIENRIEENEKKKADLIHLVKENRETVGELEKQVTELEEEFSQKQLELKEKLSQTESEELRLTKERELVTEQIEKRLLNNYNRIRNGTNGIALSEVTNYTCDECFATIPAQTAVEVRMKNRIILCEACGRILVPRETLEAQPALT